MTDDHEGIFIGKVLAHLGVEFPDIRISKIRYLESKGLIKPARSPSGYRQFSRHDVQRLRYILTAQRDRFLPLRVIKEKLDSPDGAAEPAAVPADTTGFYHEVRVTGHLPCRASRGHLTVDHGYAAEIGGSGTSAWFFFRDLEPALVFGRVARQSTRITGYGVHPAAQETGSRDPDRPERRILHVLRSERLDRQVDEREHFLKWAAMCDPRSAHWPSEPREAGP